MTKIYLYAGYYELFITDKPMPKPYVLLSWHKSVDNAEKAAARHDDHTHYAEHLLPAYLRELLEENAFLNDAEPYETAEIDGVRFAIL